MSKATIQMHVKSHYEKQHLSAETITRLQLLAQAEQENALPKKEQRHPARPKVLWLVPVAAAIAIGVLLTAVVRHTRQQTASEVEQLRVSIAQEVAHGHIKNKPVRFAAARYEELGRQMKNLNFQPISPIALAEKSLTLKGARYCSLDGNVAAQIKLEMDGGMTCTLFMAKATEKLKSLGAYTMHFDGLEIKVWEEDNIIMGLAIPLNNSVAVHLTSPPR